MEFLMKLTKPMVLLVACALLPRTVSYGTGAPIAACTSMIPGHRATSAQTSPPPFAVQTFTDTYTPNQRILVILTAPCGGSEMFGGFLLEGRRADSRQNRDVPIGKFNNPAQAKNLDGCGTAGQAVTHKNGNDLNTEIIFEWTAPAQPSGHVVLAATFAVNKTTYWVKVFSKVILDSSDNSTVDSGAEVYPTPTYCDTPPTQPPSTTGPQAPVLPLDSACNETDTCMSQCVGLSCKHYVMWSNGTDGVEFHVAARVERTTKTWMAIGFSDDRKMGDDLVVECLSFGNEFRVYTSENMIRSYGPDNVRTTRAVEQGIQPLNASLVDGVFRCSFLISFDAMSFINMTREWYLQFASGNTASFRDNKLQHRVESGVFPQVSADMISFTQAFIPFSSTGASIISSGFMQMAVCSILALRVIFHGL